MHPGISQKPIVKWKIESSSSRCNSFLSSYSNASGSWSGWLGGYLFESGTLTSNDNGEYLCFRGTANSHSNVFIVKHKRISGIPAPVTNVTIGSISFTSSDRARTTITGGTSGKTIYSYYKITSSSACSGSTGFNRIYVSSGYYYSRILTYNDNDDYVCYKAKRAQEGTWQYKNKKITGIDDTLTFTNHSANSSSVSVTINGGGTTSLNDVDHKIASSSSCGTSGYSSFNVTNSGRTYSKSLNDNDVGKYSRFRAKIKSSDSWTYSNCYQIPVPAISIATSFSWSTMKVSATITGGNPSATGQAGWAIVNRTASCTSASYTSTNFSSAETRILGNNDSNKKACFRAKKGTSWKYVGHNLATDLAPIRNFVVSIAGTSATASFTGGDSPTVEYVIKSSSSCNSSTTNFTNAGSSPYSSRALGWADNNLYICYRAYETIPNNGGTRSAYGYQKIVGKNPPLVGSITISTSAKTATASVSGGSSPEVEYRFTNSSSCGSSGFTDAGSSPYTVYLSYSHNNQYICYKAYETNANNYTYSHYNKKLITGIDPLTITASVDGLNRQATATVTGGPSTGTLSVESRIQTYSSCSGSSGFADAGSSPYTVLLYYSDNNKYICYKATKGAATDYDSALITGVPGKPTLSLSQDQNSVDASATAPQGTTLDTSSWAHTTPSSSNPTCSSASYNSAGSSENTVSITKPTDNNKYVCFKVKTNLNVYGYKKWRIDFTAPTVTVTQNNTTLTATTTATDLVSSGAWHHSSAQSSNPTCSSLSSWSSGSTETNATNGKYYCFRAKDKQGNYGYGKILVDLTPPTISLTQNNTTVSATGSSLTNYAYFKSSTNPNCSSTKTTGWSSGSSATSMTHNQWVCFRAKNNRGVYGYAEVKVNLTAPVITITQDQDSVDATATMAGTPTIKSSTWAHTSFRSSSSLTCSSTSYQTSGSSENTITITSTNNNKYVCFRVKNNLGVPGYKRHQIDYNAPVVTVTQNNTTLTAATTATDLVSSGAWHHSDPQTTNPNCANLTTWTSGSTKTNGADTKYYCFRALDKHGNYGYGKIRVNLTPPPITLTQDNTTVSATGSSLTNYAFFDNGQTNPTCDATKTTGWTTGTSATGLDDNDWVCFKAKNSLGVYGFAKLQVDLTPPTITITQDQDSVDATASAVVASTWAHSTPSSTDPTCSSASYGSAGSAENTVAITSTDNNKYVCFRVKNNLGVFGYKKYQIDYNPPTITVNRNAYQLIGTSTDTDVDDSTWFNNGPHNTEPSACATTTGYQSGKTINNAQMHKYYCFKVSDNSGNIGYLSYTIIGPGITLVLNKATAAIGQ